MEAVCLMRPIHPKGADDDLVRIKIKKEDKMRPVCKLIGEDGNVFNIMGRVIKSLKKVGLAEEAKEFSTKAFNSASYDEVLQLAIEYVEVE